LHISWLFWDWRDELMKRIVIASTIASLVTLAGATGYSGVFSQSTPAPQTTDAGISAGRVIGEVTGVDASTRQVTLKTDGGSVVTVAVDDRTSFMRAQPGAKTLEGASKIAFTDIAFGDRVLAMGKVSDDHKSVPARAVVVMTKADIAKKQDHDRAEWKRRGITGTIASLNPDTKEITVNVRSREGSHPVVIASAGSSLVFRRYAPDSIKFSDARPSSFSELKVGDQVRALGEKSEDGSRFAPEELVSGSFRTLSGTVVAVDGAANELKIKDLESKQPVTIVVRSDSLVKRFPTEFAAMLAARSQGQGPNGGPPQGDGTRPQGGGERQPRAGGAGGPGGGFGRGGGGFDFQEMLDRMPAVAVTDLKPGDMVIVSSTKGADPARVTAIAIVSGIEPLVNAMQARQAMQGGAGRRGAGAQAGDQGGFGTGLDFGIGLP
jgi:hypothetical protein